MHILRIRTSSVSGTLTLILTLTLYYDRLVLRLCGAISLRLFLVPVLVFLIRNRVSVSLVYIASHFVLPTTCQLGYYMAQPV